jgi:serine/threonine-protein kinase HipA
MDMELNVCPSTLRSGFSTYSPNALRHLFSGRKVRHVLPFSSEEGKEAALLMDNRSKVAISGAQPKYSIKQVANRLELSDTTGTHILKPAPFQLLNKMDAPANEHVTMQIAEQVFRLPTAKNAMIFFADGQPAYITRRFDIKEDGSRCLKEDFASLAAISELTNGPDFKYNYSYLQMGNLIAAYFPAAIPAKELLFRMVLFNYLFSNGDAHLKNFARLDCMGNGYGLLSPAYDLLCTRLHIADADLALHEGLYEGDYFHPSYSTFGYYAYDDFFTFGVKLGLQPKRIHGFLHGYTQHQEKVTDLVSVSFLSESGRVEYLRWYHDKRRRLLQSIV